MKRPTSDTGDFRSATRGGLVLIVSEMARHGRQSLNRLEAAGFELIERYDLSSNRSAAALGRALEGVWGVVAGSEPYTRDVLQQASDLKVIARCGVGFDAIDVDAATEMGVAVLITPGANTESVADFTLTLMLGCLRRLVTVDKMVRSGEWRRVGLADDLYGATVGIVGLGRIGRAVAWRLRGFECRLLGVEPEPDLAACAELGIELVTLGDLLPQVDVLTLHVPRLPGASSLIGAPELARMKTSAILINTSRGGIVDEQALLDALDSGAIAGAGLDVYAQEPLPPDHPLTQRSNVTLGGHVSSYTRLGVQQTIELVVTGLLDVAHGRIPAGYINPPALAEDETR